MKFTITIVTCLTMTLIASMPVQATVGGWSLFKLASYEQITDNTEPVNPTWSIYVSVNTDVGDAGSISLTGPGLISSVNLVEVEPGSWEGDGYFASKAELDAAIQPGQTYTFTLSGGALGPLTQVFDVPADDYPATPYLTGTVFSDFQALVPSVENCAEWNEPGSSSLLSIFSTSGGKPLFEEEDMGDICIPAGTLAPMTSYRGNMERFSQTNLPGGGFGVGGRVGFISLVDFDIITEASAPLIGGDDFNDNSVSPFWTQIWTSPEVAFTEINQRLEITSTGGDGYVGWEWIGNSLSTTQDWSVSIDFAFLIDPSSLNSSQEADVQLYLETGGTDAFQMKFSIEENGFYLQTQYADVVSDQGFGLDYRNLTNGQVTVRIAYDATAETLNASYDQGEGFETTTNYSISSWGLTPASTFTASIGMDNEAVPLAAGEAYADNFQIVDDLVAEPAYVLSDEVSLMKLEYSQDFGSAADSDDTSYWYSLEVETSYAITSVRAQTPGGLNITETNARDSGSGLEWSLSEWDDSSPFDAVLDGLITVTFGFSDSSFQSTELPFTLDDGVTPIPVMNVEPTFTSPSPLAGTIQSAGALNLQWATPPTGVNYNEIGNESAGDEGGEYKVYASGFTDNLGFIESIEGPVSTTQTSFGVNQGFNDFGQYQGFFRSDHNSDGIPYVAIKLSEVIHEFFVSGPTAFADDFNDNDLDPSWWGDWYPAAGASLANVNQQLEYSSPSGIDGTIGKQWNQKLLSVTQDWSVAVNVGFLTELNNIELTLAIESATNAVGMKFGSEGDDLFSIISQAFDVSTEQEHFFQWDTFYEMSNALIRIDFDATAQTFTTLLFRWGEFQQLAVIDASGWGLTPSEMFNAILYVDNSNTAVALGDAYFDNFMIWWGDGATDPNDTDNDGLPDAWEILYWGSIDHPDADPHADPDQDGKGYGGPGDNWMERIMGTDPTKANSILRLSNPWKSEEGYVLDWNSVSGRVYTVEWTDDLAEGFQPLETDIIHPQSSYTDTVHSVEDGGFYNLKVQLEN